MFAKSKKSLLRVRNNGRKQVKDAPQINSILLHSKGFNLDKLEKSENRRTTKGKGQIERTNPYSASNTIQNEANLSKRKGDEDEKLVKKFFILLLSNPYELIFGTL